LIYAKKQHLIISQLIGISSVIISDLCLLLLEQVAYGCCYYSTSMERHTIHFTFSLICQFLKGNSVFIGQVLYTKCFSIVLNIMLKKF